MASSKTLHYLATHPHAYMKWQQTGKLPEAIVPKSPLIDILRTLAPRELAAIRGLNINPSLGYNGSRIFATATQALRWMAPDREVFGSFPAQSWQNKNFQKKLTLEDVLDNAASHPFKSKTPEDTQGAGIDLGESSNTNSL